MAVLDAWDGKPHCAMEERMLQAAVADASVPLDDSAQD